MTGDPFVGRLKRRWSWRRRRRGKDDGKVLRTAIVSKLWASLPLLEKGMDVFFVL